MSGTSESVVLSAGLSPISAPPGTDTKSEADRNTLFRRNEIEEFTPDTPKKHKFQDDGDDVKEKRKGRATGKVGKPLHTVEGPVSVTLFVCCTF